MCTAEWQAGDMRVLFILHNRHHNDLRFPGWCYYADLNVSIGRHLDVGRSGSPWKAVLGTLVGSSIWCMRTTNADNEHSYRLLQARELFSLIGFSHDRLHAAPEEYATSVSMTGNAFSGFHVASLQVALMCAIGAPAP